MAAHPELADRIEGHRSEIARQASAAMHADPFTTGFQPALDRLFSPDRVARDLEALTLALRTGDAPGMVAYVRRLQRMAADAGLTSRHLAAGFRRLHDAILAIGLSEAGAARTMLDRASLALRHDGLAAASVQDASRQLAEDAVVALRGVHLGEEAIEAEWIEALEITVSYLADAMALRSPALLSGHAQRLGESAPSPARPAAPSAMLAALEGALDELPADARQDARTMLATVRAPLAAPVP